MERWPRSRRSIDKLIRSLNNHRFNTLTELCRVERIAASCDAVDDARAFQQPMTAAWTYYVASNQLLSELRGLTPSYPFSGLVVSEAVFRVRADPESNRSWNLAWLCLRKMKDDGLISAYAGYEAARPEMWAGMGAAHQDMAQLALCFQEEWTRAADMMLRHWTIAPTWR